MKVYKKVKRQVVVSEQSVHDYTECDICGKKSSYDGGFWEYSDHSSAMTTISYVTEEDNSIFGMEYDICPECFKGAFADMMWEKFKAQGRIY